ncbi:MAG: pyrroloquinoline quinone biosynthesis protein PqqB [Cyclobacteriaceae bacterium]
MSKFFLILIVACTLMSANAQSIIVLGTAQDGGYPHIGCQKECRLAWENPLLKQHVVSLAIMDSLARKWWLVEATPDFKEQLELFRSLTDNYFDYLPAGILLTHAHMGHYTGLIHLGREALGASDVPVYALPRLVEYLKSNGPWSQLVKLSNIKLQTIDENTDVAISEKVSVNAFIVPHRDEFSETAGLTFNVFGKRAMFIPDIDKWSKWDKSIVEKVKSVDIAFLDATFFADGELPNRSINEVPHPFVSETMALFEEEKDDLKSKIHFIHFNHTNPILWDEPIRQKVRASGFQIAKQGMTYFN